MLQSSYVDSREIKMGKAPSRLLVFGATLIAISAFLIPYGFVLQENWNKMMTGKLIPFQVNDKEPFNVTVGGFTAITSINELKNGFNMSRYFFINNITFPFQLSFRDGQLYVSGEIRNSNGDFVARIVNNEWQVNPDQFIAAERNYNSYAFEVIDASTLVPVFQVVITPNNKILVCGVFYGGNYALLNMLNDTSILSSLDSKDESGRMFSDIIKDYNQTLFQYPSQNHLGELVANSLYAFSPTPQFVSPMIVIIVGCILLGVGTVSTGKGWGNSSSKSLKIEKSEQKNEKKDLRFYLSDEKKGYKLGKTLGKDRCLQMLKSWNKLEKKVLPTLAKTNDKKTNHEKKLELDYSLFWLRKAQNENKGLAVSEKYAEGFRKAVSEEIQKNDGN